MVKHLIWAGAVVLAFLLGYALGDPAVWEEALGEGPSSPVTAPGPSGGPPTPAADAPRAADAGLEDEGIADAGVGVAGSDGAWYADLQRLHRTFRRGDADATAALQERLLRGVGQRARDGEVPAARRLLADYLQQNPHDPEAYLLASDLLQMQGRAMDALTPLLDLLAFANDPDVARRARDKLQLIVGVRETQLSNSGETSALVRLFEDLTLRDPTFDGHRLRLAHWLLRAGRLADAEAVLAETGTVGADPETRDDLLARVRLARTGLPLERRGNALHVSVRLAGEPVRMLVDTGATTTAIRRDTAAALGSTPMGQRVRVRTAGGVVESEVHRVRDVEVGGLHLESLTVLVLEGPLPQGVDGLLGMDVLERFQDVPGTGLTMPGAP